MSTSSLPVRLHELHPVEQFLAVLLTSAAALHRLFSEPPRVIQQKPAPFVRRDITQAVSFAAETIAGHDPFYGQMFEIAPLSSHTVRELQSMARDRGMRNVDGKPLKYCKKARLVEVLSDG